MIYKDLRGFIKQVDELGALVDKFGLKGETLGEVAAGAVIKHSRDWNLTRESTQGAGLDPHTPAYDVQQACGTGLQAAAIVAVVGFVGRTRVSPGTPMRRIEAGIRSISSGVRLTFSGCSAGFPPNVTTNCVLQSGLFASFGSGQRSGSETPGCVRPGISKPCARLTWK